MSLRDIFIFGVVFASIPFILRRPFIGILMWSWISYMSPHRLTWGIAYDFPFALFIVAATIGGVILNRAWRPIPWNGVTIIWTAFFAWTALTTAVAISPYTDATWDKWWKIQVGCILTLMLVRTREQIQMLVWVITLSIGFYGVKGGIFTITTGGHHQVLGPPGSFIQGNTMIGLALTVIMPLMGYLQIESKKWWMKWGLAGAMALTAFAIIATSSRGALLGIVGMGIFLIMKSAKRVRYGLAALIVAIAVLSFMPAAWFDKMETIQTYEEDASAMGRINAWWFAYYLALDRPLVGGGFGTFTPPLFKKYAPDPDDVHDAHSVYFEVLGEHGFPGLIFFLMLGIASYRTASRIIRKSRGRDDLSWATNLAAMIQGSLVGYAICGAFLGLAYFDLTYHLIAILLLTEQEVNEQIYSVNQTSNFSPGTQAHA